MTPERRSLLILALRSLRDVGETMQRGDGGGKFDPGSRLMTMPAAWHAGCHPPCRGLGGSAPCQSTYALLVESLATVRKLGPGHYWHLASRYVWSERQGRELVNRGGRYFEAVPHTSFVADEPYVRWEVGAPLPAHVEVLRAVSLPKAVVSRKPGDPRLVLVRAAVESWDPAVVARMVERGLDALSFLMPREIRLPRDVMVAA